MTAPLFRAADYVSAMQALLPRGRAWPRDADATQTKTLNGLAVTYERNNARANQLLVDAFPATAYELLGEWESALGLPGIFGATPISIQDRQAKVVAALTDTGGQSVAYFTGLAATLGYPITITHFKPFSVRSTVNLPIYGQQWAHAWQVNAPSINAMDFDVESSVEDSIEVWDNSTLEAVFKRYAPGHTVVIFSYY